MKRDSSTVSLWQENIPDFSTSTHAEENTIYDVIIVGGGITGVTTALQLQKSGKKCLIVEAKNIGYGTTGGTTAHINTLLDSSYEQIISDFGLEGALLVHKITRETIDLVESNVREYNIECEFKRLDGYMYAEDEKQAEELEKIMEASRKAGIPIDFTSNIPVPVSFTKAVKFGNQAQFHPMKYVSALAAEFEKLGGVILQEARALGLEENEVIRISTSKGFFQGNNLVYATHLPPGVNILHFECAPYRSYVLTAKLKDNQYPDALVYDMQDPYHYFRTYSENGNQYLVVGGEDHKTGHEENTEKFFRNLEAYVNTYFQIESIQHKWSSQYYESADGLPYIGKNPGDGSRVYVATGFSGNGITLGTASAIVLTQLIVNGTSEYEQLFRPSRVKIAASIGTIAKENLDVVKHFVGDWFSIDRIPSLTELAPDEARIVRHEGKVAAVYKDHQTEIHAVNPACTHVKCSVLWNSTERSWDCPCHGSRFSVEGEVLVGPARKDLEKVSLSSVKNENATA